MPMRFTTPLIAAAVLWLTAPLAAAGADTPEIPFASPTAAAVRVPSSPNAWGGARTGNEATLSDRVVDYQITASLDPVKHTVDGKESLTWRNRSDKAVSSIYLHLYLNGFEGNGSTFMTEKNRPGFEFRSDVGIKDGEWGHIEVRKATQAGAAARMSFVHPDAGPDTDHSVMRVDLATPVPPGATTTLQIDFFDQLPRVVARTGYFGTFHLIGQWFPKIGVLELPGERGATQAQWNVHEFHLHSEFYADYGSFDVSLTVPKDYTVGAVGEEVGEPKTSGDTVTHRFVQADVHDFAWTADNQFAKPLEGPWEGPGSPKVKIKVLFTPEFAQDAEPVLKATADSLTYFSQTLGPYPYKTVTVVCPPHNADEAGGMEYPTFFTAEGIKDVAPNTLGQIALDFVTIHEFGHGYFYGILGSNEFEEPMLDEGMNEYWDTRMMTSRNAVLHIAKQWQQRIGIDPRGSWQDVDRQLQAGLVHPVDGTGSNSWNRYSSFSYATVYARTMTLMLDLEHKLGVPVLEQAMKAYYARWKFRHPSIADLEESLAESSGKRELVESIFNQQVFAANKVDDGIEDLVSTEEMPLPGTRAVDGKWIEDKEDDVDDAVKKQRKAWEKSHSDADLEIAGPFPYRTTVTLRRYGAAVPEKIVVHFADGSSETVEWNNDQRWQRFSWVKPARGISAEMDPDRLNLLDGNRLNNTRIIDDDIAGRPAKGPTGAVAQVTAKLVGGPASRRWSSDFESVLQTVLAFFTTL
jgi:hypothetical protein